MKIRGTLLWLLALTALYLGGLAWIDKERDLLATLETIGTTFLAMAGLTLASWLLRFGRWQWLMRRIGTLPPTGRSLAAYLAGFAFTATPGKVGELARIRYYQPLGVKATDVVSAFVFERVIDLLCVLLLASASITGNGLLWMATMFVTTVLVAVAIFAAYPSLLSKTSLCFGNRGFLKTSAMIETLGLGLLGCKRWFRPLDLLVSVGLGLFAWLLLSMSFGVLNSSLGIHLNHGEAIATYPLAMLVGAASMLPGGIGSTEAVIVLVLVNVGVPLPLATTVAIGVRLTTLWLAIAVGFVAMATLELRCSRS